MAQDRRKTRYQRVRQILRDAAGGSKADYGGVGPFWELPLDGFRETRIEGVRLIAPEDAGSCCESRGDASGLVRGLRGQPPFDGSRYPRLPWGGSAVDPEDVRFIAEWIDDGLPDDRLAHHELDLESQGEPEEQTVALPEADEEAHVEAHREGEDDTGNAPALSAESHVFAVYDGLPHQYASRYPQVRQRLDIDCLTKTQLDALRDGFRKLYALNKWPEDRRNYNNLALIHQSHCQHGWERFLPWHRIYLYEFEQALEDVAPGVTMPYWDWTRPQYRPHCPEKGQRIPKALQAFLTDASVDFLENTTPSLSKAQGRKLRKHIVEPKKTYYAPNVFFAEIADLLGKKYTVGPHRERFIDALLDANALWYPIRYPGEYNKDGKPSTITATIQYHYPTAEDMDQILRLRTYRDFGGGSLYNDSFGFLDQNPHNTMHIWTGGMNPAYERTRDLPEPAELAAEVDDPGRGRNRATTVADRKFHSREDMYRQPKYGDMFSNLTAAYDPVFWPVHANVDRTWHDWQELNPHALPADLDSVLTPWSYTTHDTLDMARFGYEYVQCAYLVPVGLEAPVGRFVSQPIDIPKSTRESFDRAEVRLHRVPQLPRSCFIRVFLNDPGADATTPPRGPNYGGYLAVFGHGECYGGPGHCELPPGRPREHDLRPRSHNTPRNHRLDVTRAARALLEGGAETLRVTLVVIGADYCDDPDVLRLEGVSLNFLD